MHLASAMTLVALSSVALLDQVMANPLYTPYGGGFGGYLPFFAANNNVAANQNALLANQNFATVNANNFEQDRIRNNRFSATTANSNVAANQANAAANNNVVALKRRQFIPAITPITTGPLWGGGINTYGYTSPLYGGTSFGTAYGTSYGSGAYF
ncbi:hypothetical protein BJ684DRAFT_17758 [Piptocephalis cylindrospora]|uniref:Uncharacterized protein n=1 Tax=Piptocephalis cylindrospora TaxID=1907219 RepID=A0A4P9XZT7_9FUNG|nr:hypothetical protein BJ684DRAFT_17758 [Piptocephalis cylindrospora]|eukprot:RKP11672.1 hypothetical protein BJ684DRAFT_17758 [Piptocephalis cylindrospora]